MEDYSVLDAAVDSIENYRKALGAETEEISIELMPYINGERETVRLDYRVEIGTDFQMESSLDIEQDFTAEDRMDDLDYLEWKDCFIQKIPEANISYVSKPDSYRAVNRSVEDIENFLKAVRESPENMSVLIDPVYDRSEGDWKINFHARISPEEGFPKLDAEYRFDGEDEEFRSAYPLWVRRVKKEFPGADILNRDEDEI